MRRRLPTTVVSTLAVLCALTTAIGAPRAREPLDLADLCAPAGIARWECSSGIDIGPAPGGDGLRFTIPKYTKGAYEWPSVYVEYKAGRGYPTRDWSGYGKVALDVAVEGEAVCNLAFDLYDRPGSRGATGMLVVEPRQVLHGEVVLADLASEVDLSDVGRIQFHLSRPERAYTITIRNLRVLPPDKPPLAQAELVYPNYRGMVFPGSGPVKIDVALSADQYGLTPDQCLLTLTAGAQGCSVSTRRSFQRDRLRASLAVDGLPEGPLTLSAVVSRRSDGSVLSTHEWRLRKLSVAQMRSLSVYIDQHRNAIVDGKPFFPLGWYGSGDEKQMAEIADSPFNCILDYGTNYKPRREMLRYLDAMHRRGLKLIYCLNDVYPTATYLEGKAWEGVKGNQAIADGVLRAYRNHPALLGWYLNDELPRGLVPKLTDYYAQAVTSDPNHPCYIVLCNMAELRYFTGTTDVFGVDCYPMPRGSVSQVSSCMDCATTAVRGRMPTWFVPQAFAWYQHAPENEDGHRDKIPTPAELETGRAPTYDESRCMTYLALIHGAKGLLYWCYYDMRVLPQYKEMWGWMKRIGSEVKTLSPMLLSPDDLGPVSVTGARLDTKLKKADGRLYLLAVNPDNAACQATFDLRRALPAEVSVMFEARRATTQGNTLADAFKPLEVHVYDLGLAGPKPKRP